MASIVYFALGIVAGVLLFVVGQRAIAAWMRYRGTRVVNCPENGVPVAVDVDVRHAVGSASRGHVDLKLSSCTRWPEKANCGQECLSQIEAAPADCLAQNILASWYAGKSCHYCRSEFGTIEWTDRKPGLLSPTHRVLGWEDVAPASIPEVLETHDPVCARCLVTERFRQQHADLVVERTVEGRELHVH
jgi:hypothetical protein